jgi:hypothetical protein
MRKFISAVRFSFAKYKAPNEDLGLVGEPKDVKGMEVDKFRRFFTRANLYHAGK